MLIQAALNGTRTRLEHPSTPLSIDDLARDAAACVAAGALAIHLHPRDPEGRERLDAPVIDAVVSEVRAACGVPVGVSTGAWIESDFDRRLALIRAWRAPDYASVNLDEAGSEAVMAALIEAGVGIEAGISTVNDVERLAASGLGGQLTRILIELDELAEGETAADALRLADDIHRALDRHNLSVARLQHGYGDSAWFVLDDAIRRGIATRAGLEDTLAGPDGEQISGNEALIRLAFARTIH